MDTVTNRHAGERIIIGGTSPRALELPEAFWHTGRVIGLNVFPTVVRMPDYLLIWDSMKYLGAGAFFEQVRCEKFIRADRLPRHRFPAAVEHWFHYTRKCPLRWENRLTLAKNSCTAAAHLAVIMGAREIVLAGVDFADGRNLSGCDRRGRRWPVESVEAFLQSLPVPVYKTCAESPLDLPLLTEVVKDAPL